MTCKTECLYPSYCGPSGMCLAPEDKTNQEPVGGAGESPSVMPSDATKTAESSGDAT